MSHSYAARLPPRLAQALDTRRLVIFAGAGISKLGPSFLPDWRGFNQSLLEEAKESALRGLRVSAQAAAAIRGLTLDRIPVEAFSDLIVRGFAAEGYFSVLGVLDSEHPNANHRAIAALARRGLLRAVVTTNFDTLIERSFRRAGLSGNTIVTEDDYRKPQPPPGRCAIYKIHGSVTADSTLVDTVTQKLRGLPPHARGRLAKLFAAHHVLVLGYSGADLRFDADYLVFSAIGPQSRGLTWVTLPGRAPTPEVRQLINGLGRKGAVVESALPKFFERLAIRVPGTFRPSDLDAQRAANTRARERIRRLYDEGYVGPITSAAFCANLLSRVGDRDRARALRADLEAEVERWGDQVPKTAGTAFRALGIGAMDEGDLVAAERWTERELSFWMTSEEPELAIRQRIAVCEFAGFRDALPELFASLCQRKRAPDAPRRLLDFARGLVWSALRARDPIRRLEGVNYAAVAGALLGDRELAIAEYERALAEEVSAPDVRAVLEDNLRNLRAAADTDATKAAAKALRVWPSRGVEPNAAARNAWQLAEVFLARGDFAAAIGTLRQGAAYSEMAKQAGAQTREQTLHAVLEGLLQKREAELHDGEERK